MEPLFSRTCRTRRIPFCRWLLLFRYLSVNSHAPELTVRVRLIGRIKVRDKVRVEVRVGVRVRIRVMVSASVIIRVRVD